MISTNIHDYGQQLLSHGRISMKSVPAISASAPASGLFEHPYVNQTKAAADSKSFVTPDDRAAARKAASRSMALLRNDEKNGAAALPLDPRRRPP